LKAGRLGLALCCACALIFSQVSGAAAAPGDPDRSFGGTGVVDLAPQLVGDAATAVVVGPGNASFVLEDKAICPTPVASAAACGVEVFLARYRPNGSRDDAFGVNARAAALPSDLYESPAAAVDREGRPVLAATRGSLVTVVRLLAGGTRDSSFGNAGMASLDCGCAGENPGVELAIDADGGIVVGVRTGPLVRFFRFLPDGRADSNFGSNGAVLLDVGAGVAAWALRPDRTLAVASLSCCRVEQPVRRLRLVRIGQRGGIDERFGLGAEQAFLRRQKALPPNNRAYSASKLLARQGGGLNFLGRAVNGRAFAIAILPGGGLNERFGTGGLKLLRWDIEDAVLDPLGRVVAVGRDWRAGATVVIRLRGDGHRDRRFGGGFAVELPAVEGETKSVIAVGPNRRPVVLDLGLHACRQYCAPHPQLFRLLGGPRPGQRSR
jgi:hypothetical protein